MSARPRKRPSTRTPKGADGRRVGGRKHKVRRPKRFIAATPPRVAAGRCKLPNLRGGPGCERERSAAVAPIHLSEGARRDADGHRPARRRARSSPASSAAASMTTAMPSGGSAPWLTATSFPRRRSRTGCGRRPTGRPPRCAPSSRNTTGSPSSSGASPGPACPPCSSSTTAPRQDSHPRWSVVGVGVGVRGSGGYDDTLFVGKRHRPEPGELPGLREPSGQRSDGACGAFRGERLGFARHARERAGVGGGLPERRLRGRAVGRKRAGERKLRPARFARRFLVQPSEGPPRRRPRLVFHRSPQRLQRHPCCLDARAVARACLVVLYLLTPGSRGEALGRFLPVAQRHRDRRGGCAAGRRLRPARHGRAEQRNRHHVSDWISAIL